MGRRRRRSARLLLAGLPAVVGLAVCWPQPAGARILHTILQDDALSLFAPQALPRFVQELRWLGVDELRVSAEWKLEAPDSSASRPPRGFHGDQPSSYTGTGMQLLDRAVRAADASGLQVIIDPAFSAPRWATSGSAPLPASGTGWFNTNIDVHAAAAWEQMLARRYSGTYTPPASSPLPRVSTFTLWNEPNNPLFLNPQWSGATPVSADWDRRLAELAYPAIKRVAPYATVLIGNTSDSGAEDGVGGDGVAPLAFIRRLACVNAQLQAVHDGACADFRTVPADGYAQHPYERTEPPWVPSSGSTQADWAQMGDLPRLQALLDQLVKLRRFAPGARNLWLTEQGYETNAELADHPWSEAAQGPLDATAEYLAWRDPEVHSFAQFLLRDTLTRETLALRARTGDPRAAILGTWTSGLLREDLQPKPALAMFRSPVIARIVKPPPPVSAAGLAGIIPMDFANELEVWGRARPVRAPTLVQVQLSQDGAGFRGVTATSTDGNGIFDVRIGMPAAPLAIRFRWVAPDGAWQYSPATQPTAFPLPGS
jgi:hypothetical protein